MGMMMHRWKLRHTQVEAPKQVEVHNEIETPKNEEKNEGVAYTIEEINSLPFFSLKSVASNNGIDVKGKKANDLREELIKKLEL